MVISIFSFLRFYQAFFHTFLYNRNLAKAQRGVSMSSSKQMICIVLAIALTVSYLALPTSQADGENATLNGTVRDSGNSTLLEGVTVDAYEQSGGGNYQNDTNALGVYSMDVVDGTYTLRASEYPDYYIFERNNVHVGDSQTKTEDIDLIPHGGEDSGFTGTVTDAITGDPIYGSWLYFRDNGNETHWLGFTNETGDYNQSVVPGYWSIDFSIDGYRTLRILNVLLEDGDWLNNNLQLWPENSTLYGQVTDNITGDPIENATVSISQGNDWEDPNYYQNRTVTDDNGDYLLNLSAGFYKMQVFGPDGYYSNLMFQIPTVTLENIDVGISQDLEMDVALDPVNFMGNVTDKNGDPVASPPAIIMAFNLEGLSFSDDDDDDEDGDFNGFIAIIDDNGSYELHLTEGNWLVIAMDMAIFDDPDNATHDGNLSRVTIEDATEMGYQDFTMWDLNSSVSGLITDPDGFPLENATVQLYNNHTVMFDESKMVSTDNAGYYEIEAGRGDFFLFVTYSEDDEDDPFDPAPYKTVIDTFSLADEEDLNRNYQMQDNDPVDQYQNATMADDWQSLNTTFEMVMGLNQTQWFRLWLDGLVGNGDYYLSQEEIDIFNQVMGQGGGDDDDEGPFLVDDIAYIGVGGFNVTFVNAVGAWDDPDPMSLSGSESQMAEEQVSTRTLHAIQFNVSYNTDAATYHYNLTFPTVYSLDWNSSSDNVTFEGLNPIEIFVVMDPDPDDEQEEETVYLDLVKPNDAPTANITTISPNPATEGQDVNFEGEGEDGDGDVIAFEWYIDDELVSSDPIYTNGSLEAGNHTVKFRVQDDWEAWSDYDTATLEVEALPNIPPKAFIDQLAPDHAPEGMDVNFQGHGEDDDGDIVAHEWYLDDTLLSDQTAFVRNNIPVGNYTVSFRVQDDSGEWSLNATATLEISEINDIPVASIDDISPNPTYPGKVVTFTGSGTDSDGTIEAYEWKIAGWVASTSDTFTLDNLTIGIHVVEFKVMDDNDTWSDLVVDQVEVKGNEAPIANIVSVTPSSPNTLDQVTLNGTGFDSDGTIATYQWTLDGSIVGSQAVVEIGPLDDDTYTIGFRVKDDNNTWSTMKTQSLTVTATNHPPEAEIDSISPQYQVSPDTFIIFIGHGFDSDGSVVTYEWSIDGTVIDLSSENEYSSEFSEADLAGGNHTVRLRVQDDEGAWSEYAVSWLDVKGTGVTPPTLQCILSVTPTSAKVLTSIRIDASASTGNIANYSYDFGDGNLRGPGTYTTSDHPYANAGTYTISVTVTDVDGNTDTATATVVITAADTGGDDSPGLGLMALLGVLALVGLAQARINRKRN